MIKIVGNLGKTVSFFCKSQKLSKSIQLDDECSNYILNQQLKQTLHGIQTPLANFLTATFGTTEQVNQHNDIFQHFQVCAYSPRIR